VNGRRSRLGSESLLLDTLERAMIPRRRSRLGVIWTWRKELAILAGASVLLAGLAHTFGIPWAVVALSVAAGVFSPPWPGWLAAFWWELRTPHLLRSGLYHARIQNRNGRRPVIVRVKAEPFGERVRLWCPAGTSADDLYAARETLRAACRAADVRVTRDQQRSHLVTVDVIRRAEPGEDPDGARELAS
jgi:hypothetical protein